MLQGSKPYLTIIGGGLAGSEAALQAASAGIDVHLYEMRPQKNTGAHRSDKFAELVCSNSLGSRLMDRPAGLLQAEMHRIGSFLLRFAEETSIPAGGALAVDRELFSTRVSQAIESHPNIKIFRSEVTEIPRSPVIIASGPLTSPALSSHLSAVFGQENLFFFDAIAPIVLADSINMEVAFRASRFRRGINQDGDYINCPFTLEQYDRFLEALLAADKIPLHDFDTPVLSGVKAGKSSYFEGCLPIEVLARRNRLALTYGPMRPIGLRDPRTGQRPYAVCQLRQDNLAGTLYNLVGFQTNLTYQEQKRVFRLIPGLEKAEFIRFGQIHRNTYLASPLILNPTLQTKCFPDIFLTGQICGIEGYLGNIATGMLAGINATRFIQGKPLLIFPTTTMLGALCHYITHASLHDFQPMKANYGILPPLPDPPKGRIERSLAYRSCSLQALEQYLNQELKA
ncbi:MAG TPA: methylenetetrahydrofolate--tRNA-(uracil(54)-C(5))-methyltransferase (FADH(2)-oxidizing) TrmFO [Anaerolineaceae bacterium]